MLRRASATRTCNVPTRRHCACQRPEPLVLRLRVRWARLSLRCRCCSGRRFSVAWPWLSTIKDDRPRSMPIRPAHGGSGSMGSSTDIDTNQRPAASRDKVTIFGTPTGIRDHTTSMFPSRGSRCCAVRPWESVNSGLCRRRSSGEPSTPWRRQRQRQTPVCGGRQEIDVAGCCSRPSAGGVTSAQRQLPVPTSDEP